MRTDLDPEAPLAVGGDSMLVSCVYCTIIYSFFQSTANYAARKFGIRSGMPGSQAKKLCPNLIVLPVDFVKYTILSNMFHQVVSRQSNICRHIGYDEAYMDLTQKVEQLKNECMCFPLSKNNFVIFSAVMYIQSFDDPCMCYLPRHKDIPKDVNAVEVKVETIICPKCRKSQKKHYLDIFIPPNVEGVCFM